MDAIECGEKVAAMWQELAMQIVGEIPGLVLIGNPVKAMRFATCAEACFWKATGDAETHDVKDVFAQATENPSTEEK